MCDLCEKNKVYQVLGPGDIGFASAKMVPFGVMGKLYCVDKVACCQGCIEDLRALRDALANIAIRGDRVLPMKEILWPTPSVTAHTGHHFSCHVQDPLSQCCTDAYIAIANTMQAMVQPITCEGRNNTPILGDRGTRLRQMVYGRKL